MSLNHEKLALFKYQLNASMVFVLLGTMYSYASERVYPVEVSYCMQTSAYQHVHYRAWIYLNVRRKLVSSYGFVFIVSGMYLTVIP